MQTTHGKREKVNDELVEKVRIKVRGRIGREKQELSEKVGKEVAEPSNCSLFLLNFHVQF